MAEEIRKTWSADDVRTAAESEILSHEIDLIGLKMGIFASGGDFFLDNGFPVDLWEKYEDTRIRAIAKVAAKILHMEDEAQLLRKETRTEEQTKLMMEISAREQASRFRKSMESNYLSSIGIIFDAMREELHLTEEKDLYSLPEWDDISDACAYLNRYFYAIHREIEPAEKAALTEENREEIKEIVSLLFAYRGEHGGGFFENIAPCFGINDRGRRITEITQQDTFSLPIAKVWQRQGDIAAEGAAGRDIAVQKRGRNPVIVKAAISDKEGKPLQIDGIRRGAQFAIGNLIDANGGRLPITVTPEQVYREWARLDWSETVTDQQAQEMEAAIDSLTSSPSRIDFTAQLHEHKHMKHQADYDYEAEGAGKFTANLITAEKIEATWKNGARKTAYTIYSYPLLYRYSHIVGHMANVKNTLLTGGNSPRSSRAPITGAQRNSRDITMRHAVLTRVERMKSDEHESRRILLDEITSDHKIELTAKSERTFRKNMELYLQELKQQKEIKNFSPIMGGRGNKKFLGYCIEI